MSRAQKPAPHRFFHAMVVMGGSLALGCSGETKADDGGPGPDLTGAGGDGSGGSQASGGVSAGGGSSSPLPLGGSAGVGPASGGAAGADGGFVEPLPLNAPAPASDAGSCAREQWRCGAPGPACVGDGRGSHLPLPGACACDPTAPTSAVDCAPGEAFTCRSGTEGEGGTVLTPPVPFDCRCVPLTGPADCAACDVFTTSSQLDCTVTVRDGGAPDILCGCAVVYLR